MSERHAPTISGAGRIGWRAACTCGWTSSPYTGITGAELAFGEHLIDNAIERKCATDEPEFIPRALRCACTDTHHHRGSAQCPLTPVDPWGRCVECGDPVDEDGCWDNVDRPLCSADLHACPECRQSMQDEAAAEAATDGRW